ncbi:hypothetical protein ACG59Z_01150 [Acinetobacter sp. ABJ_C1_1]|uniref:hypothetical protein n=1 Tax=Acinetobacter sp. ABJ_C1_1 TaxID=3378321 RepID=UPI0037DD5F13
MDNYKVKVKDEAESKEAQELLFKLGYVWADTKCQTPMKFTTSCIYSGFEDGELCCDYYDENPNHQEFTLPQLRDLVVLKRNDVKDATHQDKYDASLKYVYLNGEWYEWINGWMAGCINPSKLIPIAQPQDPALISGAEALRALADGKEVEFQQNENWYSLIYSNVHVKCVLNDSYKLRLKPQTIKVELELPKPFEPKVDGEKYYFLYPENEKGYGFNYFNSKEDDGVWCQFGAWRTEDEIEQVVDQLRKIRGAS